MALVSRLGVSGFPRFPQTFTAKTTNPFQLAITSLVSIVGDLWRLAWSTSAVGPYRIFRDGVQVDETYLNEWTFHAGSNESPLLEVLADPNAAPVSARSARLTLTWKQAAASVGYRIEKFNGSTWDVVATVQDTGDTEYVYQTDALSDVTTHSFRVIPIGENGNDGTAATFRALGMIRHPDPPDVSMAFNDGAGTVTITEN